MSLLHCNSRHEHELVAGKSLKHSLKLWEEVKNCTNDIISGKTTNEKGEAFTDVIFNGIGGSFLGPLMLVLAIKGEDWNNNTKSEMPLKMHFISNTDPESFAVKMNKMDISKTLLVNMSKSGGTAETAGNLESFCKLLKDNNLEIGKHNIAITTPGSNFDKYATTNKFMATFHMNNETGGRTSVGSAIGMVPAAFAGIDFAAFLKGQCHMDKLTREKEYTKNPAMMAAILIDFLNKVHGRKNMIVLGYSDFLKEFAHYLQQLYMESLGKEYDIYGNYNPEGQTVFGGVGTGEQHAFMQQVQKGISDCFVRFVHFLKRSKDFDNVQAGSMGRQMLAFIKGTEAALSKNGKPWMTSTFEKCDMFNLGMMVAFEERIVTILAAFRDINAYDQPGVQDGKVSATDVNNLSKEIEKKLAGLIANAAKNSEVFNGTASHFREIHLKPATNLLYVDAILNDIYANFEVAESYPLLHGKVHIKREFKENQFFFNVKIQ